MSFASAKEYLLGIDLGGSSVKAIAVTPEGDRLATRRRDLKLEIERDWARDIADLTQELETELGSPARSVGLSAPGLAARDRRSIRVMPGRLQGLEGLDWTKFLARETLVPVLNDAQAALAGEAWVGAARGVDNVVMLTLGTGVGGAAKVDGRILGGAIGRAGHVGHICLDPEGAPDICRTPGSLELLVGNCSVQERTGGAFATTHDLVAAVERGDASAQSAWQRTMKHLACGIASLINVLDPEVVLLGGGITRAGKTLLDPLQAALDDVEWVIPGHRVELRIATLGEWAGAYGAAISGSQGVGEDGTSSA